MRVAASQTVCARTASRAAGSSLHRLHLCNAQEQTDPGWCFLDKVKESKRERIRSSFLSKCLAHHEDVHDNADAGSGALRAVRHPGR